LKEKKKNTLLFLKVRIVMEFPIWKYHFDQVDNEPNK